jgi:trans-aconitate 2-methyltransferase
VAADYDRVAPTYNTAWQRHLEPITQQFLDRLPHPLTGTILDLGCGTGASTRCLAARNPAARVVGVDVSPGMLEKAREENPGIDYRQADMLTFLRAFSDPRLRLVVSTWAIGYSRPVDLFTRCRQILPSGGVLAFIVNYADTLAPVFRAFSRCMLRFPERVRLAAWPRFPKDAPQLMAQLESRGFRLDVFESGEQPIPIPEGPVLPWLRQTGILAGFDSMLDLSGPAAELFENEFRADLRPLVHHYALVIATQT